MSAFGIVRIHDGEGVVHEWQWYSGIMHSKNFSSDRMTNIGRAVSIVREHDIVGVWDLDLV